MCIIDLSLLHLKIAHLMHQGTGDFMRSECVKLVLASFTLIYTPHCQHVSISIVMKVVDITLSFIS